jgi:dipeptidyl aminopeptidase/acylaminoacyl peptidase
VAGPWPTAIYLHGGPESQERPGHSPLFQELAASGIAVFAPNVRGSGGFGRSFLSADNLSGRFGAIDDVGACAAYLRESGITETGRLGCMGHSYGGDLTLAALVRFPDLFAVGVNMSGITDFATFFAYTEPWIASAAISKYGHPDHDRDLLRALSPLHRIDSLRAPVLVVHGAYDTNVPLREAEQLVTAATERGLPHRYLLFPDEGHEFLSPANRAILVGETVQWLSAHLRVPTAPQRAEEDARVA